MNEAERRRNAVKTAEQRFRTVLEQEFKYAPKIAQAILEEAQDCLLGSNENIRPGQIRVVLLKQKARHGQALEKNEMTEVTWTIDAGPEDQEVAARDGRKILRQTRIERLLEEAISQGAAASQEDLAKALQVTVRTIKRDCQQLQARGSIVSTRGKLKGIGRGQSHKSQIISRWLQGRTYDQVARDTKHSLGCVKRYVQGFCRVVNLHRKEMSMAEISLLLQMSSYLVKDYLTIYQQNDSDFCRERLQEQLDRLSQAAPRAKRGVK